RAFNLTDAQLLQIGAAIHGAPVRGCRLESCIPLNQSGGRYKAACTLILTTAGGYEATVPVFLKRTSTSSSPEAVHYRHLAGCGVATPKLYGVVVQRDGTEILFLEQLTDIGFSRSNQAEWRQFLTLLAHFNACQLTPDYLPHLHPFEQGGRIGSLWITGFSPFPPALSVIRANFRACGLAQSQIHDLTLAAQRLCERVWAMPSGLIHQDFLSDNLGWRNERAEMVVFDLHKNARGPRFADAAHFLPRPDWSDTAGYLDESPLRRNELTVHYLQEYARFGGGDVPLEEFHSEASLLFWAHKTAILWWFAQQQDTQRINQVLNYLRNRPG
ncbi:MAG TPA: phosphotransferase, partial [Chthonomonadales bacterium]|nr:phosphotransferase [Chthonomonadales bacterium]